MNKRILKPITCSIKIIFFIATPLFFPTVYAGTFQIDGDFDGCDYDKYYPIWGYDLLLMCKEYNYFYEYMPEVRTDQREVITIGDERVEAIIVDGRVIETRISDDFDGCDYDKRYELDNGLIFLCNSYSYSYSYRPKVKIVIPFNGKPEVYIKGKKYRGDVYRQ